MKNSRRHFIKQSAFGLAGIALVPGAISCAARTGNPPAGEVMGLQLYSLRDDMASNPLATLQAVAGMGYKNVEHANYVNRKFYGWPAAEFRKILADLGMQMPTGHTVLGRNHWDAAQNDFTDLWKYTVEDAATVGQKIVISPSMDNEYRKSLDGLKTFMDIFNKSGELCRKSGMKFGYHNHDFEFREKLEGVTLFDHILQLTDPALVTQQLDIGNMYHAGGIAKDILNKYPGRFESIHVKDEIKAENGGEMGGSYESCVLGQGIIPVKTVLDLGREKGGTKYFIVEQESYQNRTPLQAMKMNYEQMKAWGY